MSDKGVKQTVMEASASAGFQAVHRVATTLALTLLLGFSSWILSNQAEIQAAQNAQAIEHRALRSKVHEDHENRMNVLEAATLENARQALHVANSRFTNEDGRNLETELVQRIDNSRREVLTHITDVKSDLKDITLALRELRDREY